MIEGSVSRRPKNKWVRRIRIRNVGKDCMNDLRQTLCLAPHPVRKCIVRLPFSISLRGVWWQLVDIRKNCFTFCFPFPNGKIVWCSVSYVKYFSDSIYKLRNLHKVHYPKQCWPLESGTTNSELWIWFRFWIRIWLRIRPRILTNYQRYEEISIIYCFNYLLPYLFDIIFFFIGHKNV